MSELDDIQLLREFAEHRSDAAFGTLVTRHIHLVYSAALRQLGHPQDAEEITQAVFLILARKSAALGPKTILSGWLYQTVRLTAANWRRTQIRRARREQEAYMQSLLNEPVPDVWPQMAPLLDDALGRLGDKDRNAVVLRFFENKSLLQVGTALGTSETAARMRVTRAVEKLRRLLAKRGVRQSAAAIGAAMTTNSVQSAPAGLIGTIAATAAHGASISSSTLAIVEGALNVMAWMKAKTVLVIGAAILLAAGSTTVMVQNATSSGKEVREQRLADGSVLLLSKVLLGATNEFLHGSGLERMLGNAIPSNGLSVLRARLTRPTRLLMSSDVLGRSELALEFKLAGSNSTTHALAKPAFYRQFRFVLRGEEGTEFVQEMRNQNFQSYAQGCFGYVVANRFPRDSRWLWVRVEQRPRSGEGGPWSPVAEFKFKNPAPAVPQPWTAEPAGASKRVEGREVSLGPITVVTQPHSVRDIWNHAVTIPFQVQSNGVSLTNWAMPYARIEDASGNWDHNFASHRGLDARFVWKLQADFEPESDFAPENLAILQVSRRPFVITTNVLDVPVTVSWDGSWMDARMPTNRADLALRFVCVTDEQGNQSVQASGSWGRFSFRKGSFYFRQGDTVHMMNPVTATIAVVPNVSATFYAQPRLIKSETPVR